MGDSSADSTEQDLERGKQRKRAKLQPDIDLDFSSLGPEELSRWKEELFNSSTEILSLKNGLNPHPDDIKHCEQERFLWKELWGVDAVPLVAAKCPVSFYDCRKR